MTDTFSPITHRLAWIAMLVIRDQRTRSRVSQWENWK
jgi:hypothetical protein